MDEDVQESLNQRRSQVGWKFEKISPHFHTPFRLTASVQHVSPHKGHSFHIPKSVNSTQIRGLIRQFNTNPSVSHNRLRDLRGTDGFILNWRVELIDLCFIDVWNGRIIQFGVEPFENFLAIFFDTVENNVLIRIDSWLSEWVLRVSTVRFPKKVWHWRPGKLSRRK